jgi:hypothetical protein
MTPKEKAQELVLSMLWQIESDNHPTIISEKAIRCALITVDEMLSILAYTENYIKDEMGKIGAYLIYWQEVKQEINNL